MEAHYEEVLCLSEIAAACGVSPFHLSHAFSAGLGVPPMAYLGRLRLEKACRQLREHSEQTVAEICYSVGFQSVSQFNRAFRAVMACSPSEYRRSARA
jgi:AraC-like DNA-binding protein